MPTTLIKNAAWLVAWNGVEHVYLKDEDIVFRDDRILFVGWDFEGWSDIVIDGADLMIMPGLVNVHSHPSHEPAYRGIREEHGVSNMYMTGLYERASAFDTSSTGLRHASLEVGLCEFLKSGVTAVCDVSPVFDGWVGMYEKGGMRGFLSPGYSSARWKLQSDHDLGFEWGSDGGRAEMDRALAFLDDLASHQSNLLSGVVSPIQIENCNDDLLRDSFEAANDRGGSDDPTPWSHSDPACR